MHSARSGSGRPKPGSRRRPGRHLCVARRSSPARRSWSSRVAFRMRNSSLRSAAVACTPADGVDAQQLRSLLAIPGEGVIPAAVRIFVCTEFIDMRKGFDRLAQVVKGKLGGDQSRRSTQELPRVRGGHEGVSRTSTTTDDRGSELTCRRPARRVRPPA